MSPYWKEKLRKGEIVLIDGGMGTELDRREVPMDGTAWSGAAMLHHLDTVREVHEDYIRAGADVIITNTFGSARQMLEPAGYGDDVETINRRAVKAARSARDNAAEGPVAVAGSISAMPAGFDRDAYPEPDIEMASYRELAKILADNGVDLIALEMMQETEHAPRATEAAAETGLPIWLGISVRRDDRGRIVSHGQEAQPLEDILDTLLPFEPSVINIMHSRIDAVAEAIRIVQSRWSGPVGVYPESGYYEKPGWRFVDVITPDDLVVKFEKWVTGGTRLVGGCCGTGPEHIQALKDALPHLQEVIR